MRVRRRWSTSNSSIAASRRSSDSVVISSAMDFSEQQENIESEETEETGDEEHSNSGIATTGSEHETKVPSNTPAESLSTFSHCKNSLRESSCAAVCLSSVLSSVKKSRLSCFVEPALYGS